MKCYMCSKDYIKYEIEMVYASHDGDGWTESYEVCGLECLIKLLEEEIEHINLREVHIEK